MSSGCFCSGWLKMRVFQSPGILVYSLLFVVPALLFSSFIFFLDSGFWNWAIYSASSVSGVFRSCGADTFGPATHLVSKQSTILGTRTWLLLERHVKGFLSSMHLTYTFMQSSVLIQGVINSWHFSTQLVSSNLSLNSVRAWSEAGKTSKVSSFIDWSSIS